MILGVDYASVDGNGPPQFAAARMWGVRFAVVRAVLADGGTVVTDPTWARDRAAARAAGLQVAPYLPIGWSADAVQQADQLIASYGEPSDGDLPPAIDVEGISGISPTRALAKIEQVVVALRARYPTVLLYTSHNVWTEQLADAPSEICSACPLWLKVGYPWRARNPPHVESIPAASPVPRPWRSAGSPGAFIEQFQGDAIGVPGFSKTVDLDVFLPYTASAADSRTAWIRGRLAHAGIQPGASSSAIASAIQTYQARRGLVVDGVVGPATWARLCAER